MTLEAEDFPVRAMPLGSGAQSAPAGVSRHSGGHRNQRPSGPWVPDAPSPSPAREQHGCGVGRGRAAGIRARPHLRRERPARAPAPHAHGRDPSGCGRPRRAPRVPRACPAPTAAPRRNNRSPMGSPAWPATTPRCGRVQSRAPPIRAVAANATRERGGLSAAHSGKARSQRRTGTLQQPTRKQSHADAHGAEAEGEPARPRWHRTA